MLTRRETIGAGGAALAMAAVWAGGARTAAPVYEFRLTDAEWRKRLSPAAYQTLRHEATEAPFSSPLNAEHRRGIFLCGGCALPLFASTTKFDSGTGWPSFWKPLPNAVATKTDIAIGVPRTEVHCRRCGGHLGHVFDDGPKPTGLRYCMNGVALRFQATAA
jgi:peptide-methionine (R)-S-oxide reductase